MSDTGKIVDELDIKSRELHNDNVKLTNDKIQSETDRRKLENKNYIIEVRVEQARRNFEALTRVITLIKDKVLSNVEESILSNIAIMDEVGNLK